MVVLFYAVVWRFVVMTNTYLEFSVSMKALLAFGCYARESKRWKLFQHSTKHKQHKTVNKPNLNKYLIIKL